VAEPAERPAPGPGPHRLRQRHARVHGLADRAGAAPALLGRHDDHEDVQEALLKVPADSWTPTYDRIRNAKDTGLRNLPLKGFAQNQLWCEIVALACELLAWTRCSPSSARPAAGNPSACACASSPSPGGSRAAPTAAAPPGRNDGLGRQHHRRGRPPAGPAGRLTSRNSSDDREGEPRGPWNPAHPARHPGSRASPAPGKQSQPSTPGQQVTSAKDIPGA
jgi:hypothetical protein